jgi:polyisoprenoid-binding protein YceI
MKGRIGRHVCARGSVVGHLLLCLLLLGGFGASALAQKQAVAQKPTAQFTVTLSPEATHIRWTLGTTLHTVHGTFRLKSGRLHIDPAAGAATGEIIIDATSGESGDDARDRRMHGAVLESAQYPTITFRPKHVSGKVDLAATGEVKVDGVLNLHGADYPLQITVHLKPQGSGVRLATHFSVPYVAWGLKNPSTFVLRADKEVVLDVEATFAPGAGHSAAKPVLPPSAVHTAQ